jgi:hypothetical protein
MSAGGLATAAVITATAPPPQKTVTVDLSPGPTGPTGARGATGAAGATGTQGPSGAFSCYTGYVPGILIINQPGGHVQIYTCIAK